MENEDPQTTTSPLSRRLQAPTYGPRETNYRPGPPATDDTARAELRRLLVKIKEHRDRGLNPEILSVSLRTVLRLSHEDLARLWAAAKH